MQGNIFVITTQFAINLQLANLPIGFVLESHLTNYKDGVFLVCPH
jgi:hypothetical protein